MTLPCGHICDPSHSEQYSVLLLCTQNWCIRVVVLGVSIGLYGLYARLPFKSNSSLQANYAISDWFQIRHSKPTPLQSPSRCPVGPFSGLFSLRGLSAVRRPKGGVQSRARTSGGKRKSHRRGENNRPVRTIYPMQSTHTFIWLRDVADVTLSDHEHDSAECRLFERASRGR